VAKRTAAAQADERILYEIVSTVGSSLELGEVLDAVVRLLSDASAVHACFVYLLENDHLVLRAASAPYANLAGSIALEKGEGIAWWAVEHGEPAFTQNAVDDPRNKFVPELEEEKFQSLLSVPVSGRAGDVIGAITMHTEAPREFSAKEVELLTSTASLVAGAIENARLYEETRQRVGELEHLTELAETLARARQLGEVLPAVAERTRQLVRSRTCHVYLLDGGSEELRLKASAPADAEARATIRLSELGPELARSGRSASVAVPIVADDELLGLISAEGTTEVDLARAAANQTAVAIKKIELIERLTEKNLIKDFFEQLAGGNVLGAVEGAPPDEAIEKALRASTPGSLFDHRDDSSRALLRVPSTGAASLVERVEAVHAEVGSPVSIGISNPCKGAASFQAGFEEAGHALLGSVIGGTPGVMTYEELGPYKYLLRMSLDSTVRDSQRDLIVKIADYDRQRQTSLLRTLEEFLRRRGNISATAEALYVHPNTLRQRLRRIQEISGLDLRKEDWLLIEIAVKMVRLQEALGRSEPT
jgi:GAF domain-containing protein